MTRRHVTADGGILCSQCVREEAKRLSQVQVDCPDDDQWRIIAVEEADPGDQCDHCYKQLSSSL